MPKDWGQRTGFCYDAERALAIDTLVGLNPMFAPTKRGSLVRLNLTEKEGRSEKSTKSKVKGPS